MALSDLSFKLYTDSGLTTAFGGTESLVHNSNLSDNPQDFTFYFGSTDVTKTLQEYTNPGVNQITLTPTDTLPKWAVSVVHVLGDLIQPSTSNGKVYTCSTAGTSSGTTEPTWPTSGIGSTVSDGTVVWTYSGAKHTTSEITMALTSGALATNTPGAAINLGTTLTGGTANKVAVYMRINNAVTSVRTNTGHPEIGVNINTVVET